MINSPPRRWICQTCLFLIWKRTADIKFLSSPQYRSHNSNKMYSNWDMKTGPSETWNIKTVHVNSVWKELLDHVRHYKWWETSRTDVFYVNTDSEQTFLFSSLEVWTANSCLHSCLQTCVSGGKSQTTPTTKLVTSNWIQCGIRSQTCRPLTIII